MWMYLFMYLHLQQKEVTEQGGLESIMWDRIKRGEKQSIFPMQRARCLGQEEKEEDRMEEVAMEVERMSQAIQGLGDRLDSVLKGKPAIEKYVVTPPTGGPNLIFPFRD